ncbi:MAG: hypothetical protein ACMG51_10525 [Ginsengibacter sp.]
MNPSPLTFLDLKFFRVKIETDFRSKIKAEDFDFFGATLGWSVKHGREENDGSWWVAVGFVVSNENSEVICPYTIDVQALGSFSVSEKWAIEKHEQLVYENGAALVYGAIRDMVSTVTARSLPGGIMLPTPTFVGTYNEFLKQANNPITSEIEQETKE